MIIAVASGKGGTGKTSIATSLSQCLSSQGSIHYMDCDVEAPNGHLFLKPTPTGESDAVVMIPEWLPERCTLCGKCTEVCQFNALVKAGQKILVFPQLCHGCGSCSLNCPEQAFREVPYPIGKLQFGTTADGIQFSNGLLTIGEPMATPIIRQLKKAHQHQPDEIEIRDAPPGASCSVVETLRGTDFALLVTEPTSFGLHDLKQMVSIVREMNIPAGIIVNRDGMNEAGMQDSLLSFQLPILMRIPFDRELAAGLARGETIIQIMPAYNQKFLELYSQLQGIIHEAKRQ